MTAISNLVRQTSPTAGTGDLTLANANGYRSFNTAFGTGGTDAFFYFVAHRSAGEWEYGTGHLADATTLVRDTVLGSSNSDNPVNFSAGTKDVMNDLPAELQVNGDDLAAVALSGAYGDLSGRPTLGTAAAADTSDFATAAQGSLADTAVQPGDLGDAAFKDTGTGAGDVAAGNHSHAHFSDTNNPHSVTKTQVGLGNVTNDAQLPLAGGTMTGNIAFSGSQTVDGRDVSADGSKLDGIEAGADVTDAENVSAAAGEIVTWRAATAGSGAISFDCEDGERLCWYHTATGSTFVNAPVNLPDGMTCYLELDPAGQTITWGSAYRDDPPDPVEKSLIAIVRRGSEYIAALAHEEAA